MKRKKIITQKTVPYLFCAPFIISFFVFLVYPMLNMVYTSFYKLQGINSYRFVGTDNYKRLLADTHIGTAIMNSIGFTIGIIVVNVTMALLLAVVLNNKITPLRKIFRSAIYIPALTSIIVAGIFFRLFFGIPMPVSRTETNIFSYLLVVSTVMVESAWLNLMALSIRL